MSSARAYAALVCPSAPFLVPIRASTAVCLAERQSLQCLASNNYATFSRGPRKPSKFLGRLKREQEQVMKGAFNAPPRGEASREFAFQFRGLIQAGLLDEVIQMYPKMAAKGLLSPTDTLEIARLLHNRYRRTIQKSALLKVLLPFADVLVHDYKKRIMPPHRAASLHLISFFKEAKQYDKGNELWEWLVTQNDEYVDAAVYGAGIEMLAYQGSSSSKDLEDIYIQALKRFPGSFAEYHLSPEAVVPDRSQPMIIKGLPMSLLQGIITARVLHGDWKRAYVGFDTALRLFPTQVPARIFEVLMLERPVSEAYKVFLIACRAGSLPQPYRLTSLLDRLADAMLRCSPADQMILLDGMVNAIHAYVGAGGVLTGHHISVLIKGLTNLLPSQPGISASNDESIADPIILLAQKLVLAFGQAGIAPSESTFGSLIGLAGKAKRPDMVESTLDALQRAGLKPNPIIRRAVVKAAGQVGDQTLLEDSWRTLVADAEAQGLQLDARDWVALAKSGRKAGQIAYVQQQMQELSHATTEGIIQMVETQLEKPEWQSQPAVVIDLASMELQMAQLLSRILLVLDVLKAGRLQDFYQMPLTMSLQPSASLGDEGALRKIYDELSTDASQPTPLETAPAKSLTGFPLDELRFENWVSVNELLAEAEAHEAEKQKMVEEAIETGTPLSTRPIYPLVALSRVSPAFGAEKMEHTEEQERMEQTLEELRRRILGLRGWRQEPEDYLRDL